LFAREIMDIRHLVETDLAAADELRRLAGWNQTIDDWRLLLSFEPQGCFVEVQEGKVIGTVTTTTYGRALAWIGMMLVHPDHRRRGMGTRLMRHALDYLQQSGVECIRLDATPAGQPLYEKLGFVSEWTMTRYRATAVSGTKDMSVRELAESDWPPVGDMDATAFGVTRTRVLRGLAERSRASLIWPSRGPIAGYGMLRPGSHCDYLGPLVCNSPEGGSSLISTLLNSTGGRPVFWDVPNENPMATTLARRFGFVPVRRLERMRLGSASIRNDPSAQLAIADPSLG
jgi:ribosomal protein S18 acetylase RimI-like enzyme